MRSRSTVVNATSETLHSLVNDFHEWVQWSPWEEVDPQLQRRYSGSESGEGARYDWSGNKKAGTGHMTIASSTPNEIAITLEFTSPWKAVNPTTFTFTPEGGGTRVTWRMVGRNRGMMVVFAKLFRIEKAVGADFERGLAKMKVAAERS